MTINELYRSFLKELKIIYSEHEAANITSMIFESVAGITKKALIKDPVLIINESTALKINECLAELKLHKPVQYILGEAWFCNMKLKVSPAVLIPRPETEELVDAAIRFLNEQPAANAIDIGTGSGCIAIAIKKKLPAVAFTAIDVSAEALAVARENSISQHTDILFLQMDFLEEKSWEQLLNYNMIISNPPYIPMDELEKLDKNVTAHEPHLALFVPQESPLIFYEKIALFGEQHLVKGGKIFMETHEDFAGAVSNLFNNDLYKSVIKNDMFEKRRMVIATRCR